MALLFMRYLDLSLTATANTTVPSICFVSILICFSQIRDKEDKEALKGLFALLVLINGELYQMLISNIKFIIKQTLNTTVCDHINSNI